MCVHFTSPTFGELVWHGCSGQASLPELKPFLCCETWSKLLFLRSLICRKAVVWGELPECYLGRVKTQLALGILSFPSKSYVFLPQYVTLHSPPSYWYVLLPSIFETDAFFWFPLCLRVFPWLFKLVVLSLLSELLKYLLTVPLLELNYRLPVDMIFCCCSLFSRKQH